MIVAPLIYIVEDDESIRASLQRLLGKAGYQARAYGSTVEFLLDSWPDRSGYLLLDLRLPGPSGLELRAALRRRGSASSPVEL